MLTQHLPRSWTAALDQLRRDVRMVGARVAGRGAPPLVKGTHARARTNAAVTSSTAAVRASARAQVATSARGARENARALLVARVVRETPDAVTLVLRDPRGADVLFDFEPGQFFTLLTTVDGEVHPRNYSASNVPGTDELHLTVKTKPGGKVSPVLARVAAGERVEVLGPFGSFVVPPPRAPSPLTSPSALHGAPKRRLVLVAGGAGITPLASIARTLLATEPLAELAMVVANRRHQDVIFGAELAGLAAEHGARFSLLHVLEESAPAAAEKECSPAFVGRLDRATAARTLAAVPLAENPETRFYVCGPDGMRDEVLAALAERGVAESAILIERFSTGPRPHVATSSAAIAASVAPGARPVTIRVKDRTHRTVALPGATVLEAGLAAGAPMPFSCAVGGCGACRVRLVSGEIELDEPNCLSEAERAAGYVLACVGRPCGACVVEVVAADEPAPS